MQCSLQNGLNNKLNWIARQTYPLDPSMSTDFTSISLPSIHPLHKNTSLVFKLSHRVQCSSYTADMRRWIWRWISCVPAPSATNHTSLLFFACLHFQCWTNTLHTTTQSNKETVWMCVFTPILYTWQYWYIATVLIAFARNVFYGGCSVFIWLPLILLATQINWYAIWRNKMKFMEVG